MPTLRQPGVGCVRHLGKTNFLVACMGVVPSPGPRDALAALLTAAGLECGLSISIPCPHLRPHRIIMFLHTVQPLRLIHGRRGIRASVRRFANYLPVFSSDG